MQASFAAFIFVSCARRAACGCAAVIEATRQSLRTVTALPSERNRITLLAASPGARAVSFPLIRACLSSASQASAQPHGTFHVDFRTHSLAHVHRPGPPLSARPCHL